VAKYDEVIQTLDNTRDLYKQIVNIANDAVKQQKKLARKEALERMQQDIAKVCNIIRFTYSLFIILLLVCSYCIRILQYFTHEMHKFNF